MRTGFWMIAGLAVGLAACAEPAPKPAEPPAKARLAADAPCDPAQAFDCTRKGRAFLFGKGVAKDSIKAHQAYEFGCQGGNLNACAALGGLLMGSGADMQAGRGAYLKACEGGYPFACVQFANGFLLGHGVDQDYAKAKAYLERACNDMRPHPKPPLPWEVPVGQAYACDNLGVMYENGWGVQVDWLRAHSLAAFACENGWASGCNQVGVFIARGWVPGEHSADEPLTFYRKACDLGDGNGCCNAAKHLKQRAFTTDDGKGPVDFVQLAKKLNWNCKLSDGKPAP